MVASYIELLAERYQGRLDAKADKYIGYAVDGAKRMQVLINDLLNLSRIGRNPKPFEKTDCRALVAEVLEALGKSVEESKAKVAVSDNLPMVMADRNLLGLLFQNLIGNAIKYRSDRKPVIEVSAARNADAWVFEVRDNGIGIASEFHDRIFVVFQRLHERGKYPGTGIGLAIARKIAELHGGRIWVESTEGSGSRFMFTIPDNLNVE